MVIYTYKHFEWDEQKNLLNQSKHGVSFEEAIEAFFDKQRVITRDILHSQNEDRYFCFGKIDRMILTIRFTLRGDKIRIFGAGYWREGVKKYEKQNQKI